MIEELAATAKQVGIELINLSNLHANAMQSWSEILAQNPGSVTAKLSAGFASKPSATPGLQMIVDVLTPPDSLPVLRTWAIETKTGGDQKQYTNNIQLAFTVRPQPATQLVAQSGNVTRENIRQLLAAPDSTLLSVTVANEASGTVAQLTSGERYDFTIEELATQQQATITHVGQALQAVLDKLKQATSAPVNPPASPPAASTPANPPVVG